MKAYSRAMKRYWTESKAVVSKVYKRKKSTGTNNYHFKPKYFNCIMT